MNILAASIAYFLSFNAFIPLNSVKFCNQYIFSTPHDVNKPFFSLLKIKETIDNFIWICSGNGNIVFICCYIITFLSRERSLGRKCNIFTWDYQSSKDYKIISINHILSLKIFGIIQIFA